MTVAVSRPSAPTMSRRSTRLLAGLGFVVLSMFTLGRFANFSLATVAAFALCPVTLSYVWRQFVWMRRYLVASTCAAFAALLSNVAAGASAQTTAGAVAVPASLALTVAAIAWLVGKNGLHLRSLLIVIVISHAAYAVLRPTEAFILDAWKFGFGMPVTLFVASLSPRLWRAGRTTLVLGVTVSLAALNLVLGFRGLALICLLAAAILAATRRNESPKARTVVALAALVGLGSFALLSVYAALAERGSLGADSTTSTSIRAAHRPGFSSRLDLNF